MSKAGHLEKLPVIRIYMGMLLYLATTNVYAEPIITQVVATGGTGASFQVSGTGFGTKPSAGPFRWDGFENGTLGANITTGGWTPYQSGGIGHVYSGTRAHTGSKSALRVTPSTTDDFRSAGLKGLQSKEIYYSVWFMWNKISGNYDQGTPIVKVMRVNSTPDFYSGSTSSPSFWITHLPTSGWTYAGMVNNSGSITDQQDVTSSALTPSVWHRMELRIRLSDPAGSSNGIAKVWLDGVPSYSHISGVTRTASEAGKLLDNFLLPAMIDRGGQVMEYSVDDVYVDNTQARVEVCASATWVACVNNKDVQVASSWSDSSITFTVRGDAFPAGQALYLYIVDKDGGVNPNGYALPTRAAHVAPNSLTVIR